MCKLEISTCIPDLYDLEVEIGTETRSVNSITKQIKFELAEGEYEVKIKRVYNSNYNKPLWWLFCLLTLPFQLIYAVLWTYSDKKWDDSFMLSSVFKINVSKEVTNLVLKCTQVEGRQKSSSFKLSESDEISSSYIYCEEILKDCFWSFVKNFCLVFSIAISMFTVILIAALLNANVFMSVFSSVILSGLLILLIISIRTKYKDFVKIKEKLVVENIKTE